MNELIDSLPLENLPLAGQLWVYKVFAIVFASLVIAYLGKLILDRIEARALATKSVWDDALVIAVRKPLWVLIWSMGLFWAARITALRMDEDVADVLETMQSVLLIGLLAWFLLRLASRIEERLVDPRYLQKPMDQTTVSAIGKLLRISVVITSGLVILQTLGYSVSGVLAFGGIGGIFAKRPIYVPNAIFTNVVLQNPSRMSHRRIFEQIGIRYDDIQHMEPIVKAVREMLKKHPDIAQDQTQMLYFDRCAASSVDFFIYCFTTPVWAEYHRIKEDVLLKILAIIVEHEAQVAFPTSTLHVPDGVALRTGEPDFSGPRPHAQGETRVSS